MIPPKQMTNLHIPLLALPGFDPAGLRCADGVIIPDAPGYPWRFINLADASTRDRLTRYVAKLVGLKAGCTAPAFRPAHALGLRTWELWTWELLTPDRLEMAWFSAEWKHDSADGKFLVPALSGLDPHDPAENPDGSRRADCVALGLVAVHLAVRS